MWNRWFNIFQLLKEKTLETKAITGKSYFKFNEEDGIESFNIRNFLNDLPDYKLDKLRTKYRIPKRYAKYAVISQLLTMPDINKQILLLIDTYKTKAMEDEDRELARTLLATGRYL